MNLNAKLRYASALVAFGLAVSAAGVADAATIAGSWNLSGSIPGAETIAPICVFQQAGARLSGVCRGPSATGPIVGRVSGNAVTWSWHKVPTNNLQVNSIVTFRAVFSAGAVRGTFVDTADRGLVGSFVGRRI
jgi:hypothetical protein